MKLGHAVRTSKEALTLAADDLDTATSFLQVRHVAGDEALTDDLAARSMEQWQKRSKRWLEELSRRVRQRHDASGEVAFLLEPDLKDGRGGLRDVHALRWAEAARHLLLAGRRPRPRRGLRRAPLGAGRAPSSYGPARRPAAARGAGRGGRVARRAIAPTPSCTRWRRPPAPSPGAATMPGSGSTRRCAGRRDGGLDATERSGRAWCCATGRCTSPPTPTRRPTRPWCCGRPPRPPPATPGSTAARSIAWRPRPARCRCPGPTTCGGRSSTCSLPGTAPSRWSRRSTRWACGCTCSLSGRPSAASPSATPTTASRSTGT